MAEPNEQILNSAGLQTLIASIKSKSDASYASKQELSDAITTAIGDIKEFSIKVVTSLPTEDIDPSTIYLVPNQSSEDSNIYDEYIYIRTSEESPYQWELIGSKIIDLTDYAKTADVESTYTKKTDAESTYAKKTDVDATYAKKTDVDATYAKKTDVESTYAKTADVDSKLESYAKTTDVESTYAKKTDVESTYAKKTDVESTYAKKADIETTLEDYVRKDDALSSEDIQSIVNSAWV